MFNALKIIALVLFLSTVARAENKKFWIQPEAGLAWQSRNDVQIPADSGTRFSLTELGKGPFFAGRIYLGYRFAPRHEIRALYAPLSQSFTGQMGRPISFQGQTFMPEKDLIGLYRFNSYRLTYRYVLIESQSFEFDMGLTGKVRDAEIRLTQGSVMRNRIDLGFVPLLHFASQYRLSDHFSLGADLDALVSPYGRAEDFAFFGIYQVLTSLDLILGYRTVEGGAAGGGNVYNFAWLHYLVVGARVLF